MTDDVRDLPHQQPEKDKRLIALTVLAFLAVGTYVVLSPFLVSIAWATILVFVTWPAYRFIREPIKHRPGFAAGLMTTLLGLIIVVPVGFLLFAAVDELTSVTREIENLLNGRTVVPARIKELPWIGPWLYDSVQNLIKAPGDAADPDAAPGWRRVLELLKENQQDLLNMARGLVGGVFGIAFKLSMCLFAAYFLYRHGDALGAQVKSVANRVGGKRYENLLQTIRATVRAAVLGVLLTAAAQGFLAGIGYFAVGAPVPLVLALATVVASLIPFAPPIIYLGAAGAMLARGDDWGWPLGLVIWGVSVVSTADNVIRPLFISQATSAPLLLVFMGVIGGIVAFGLIGVILGPVILTVAMVLWNEWAHAEADAPGPAA